MKQGLRMYRLECPGAAEKKRGIEEISFADRAHGKAPPYPGSRRRPTKEIRGTNVSKSKYQDRSEMALEGLQCRAARIWR
jgi:hypothetical protein